MKVLALIGKFDILNRDCLGNLLLRIEGLVDKNIMDLVS